ncbi:hypothetical protein TASIC1_0012030300 [Trichoderma asperellum]|uniref:Nucleoside phosphorylase domain-containing protein n=1 Tax=Trichoderma asperellum TaxID=101201 RepID=A0A6V8R412_TRIAP|nr:hypothetical protein TASIC1_0012030300 [Trichoderma asperellum]
MWGDTGPPRQGEIVETELTFKVIKEDVDSGFGSNSTVSEIESHSFFQPKSETEYSAKPEEPQHQATMKDVPNFTTLVDSKMYTRNHYTVGIICALPKELMAVRALFDNRHSNLSTIAGDSNQYALGDMEGHWVVATCLPDGEYGTNSAASVASNLKCSFSTIRFCLLVGIGGGVPSEKKDIRLGDVVVSLPTGTSPGVLQYDLGKEENGDHFRLIGNRVVKDVKFRNRLAREHNILCFEMEAAGVINTVDCLVIRGICDYCDAQKNDVWQAYAAAAAAAYAKLLLGVVAKVEYDRNVT